MNIRFGSNNEEILAKLKRNWSHSFQIETHANPQEIPSGLRQAEENKGKSRLGIMPWRYSTI